MASKTTINITTGSNTSVGSINAGENVDVGRTSLLGDYHEAEQEWDVESEAQAPSALDVQLFQALRDKFNLEEMESICWELGIRFEDLSAKGLTGKARQLVERAVALAAQDQLVTIVKRERPDLKLQ
jgi:hypothetical protein